MNTLHLIVLSFICPFAIVSIMHPILVKIAKEKNIVDNPNPRKLQRRPIPVLGGVGVITGLLITIGLLSSYLDAGNLLTSFAIIFMMLFIGVADDILDLRADLKLVWQFAGIALLILCGGFIFDNLGGLFGIHEIPSYLAIILTMIGCTGMITAVNFIDGVDGLVSGYGIIVSMVSGIAFLVLGDISFAIFAFATASALLPFFFRNVFGDKNKMFFGDGGSMALGVIFSILILHLLQISPEKSTINSPLAFVTALFSLVLFDGFRVIVYRFWIRKPWQSGKHHLHHFFIDFGFSHFGTTCVILGLNLTVLGIWYLSSYTFELKEELVLLFVCMYGLTTVSIPWAIHSYKKKYLKTKNIQLKSKNIENE